MKGQKLSRNPWSWVPSLYFAEGIPYFIVNVLSVTMFKRLGMSNGDLAMYTSLLYLPWVIKPLWSPFVDIIRTKRWWILSMQALMTAGFAALALSVSPDVFGFTLVFFYIVAFASATHDIAADGYYMIALNQKDQSLFVGIRSTFYRIASVFGQGVIVVVAGQLEESTGRIPLAWSLVLLGSSVLFAALSLWHWFVLPKAEKDSGEGGVSAARKTAGDIFREFGNAWLTPFMLDPVEEGGLGLTTTQSGLVYGTVGVIALTVGGILGGIFAARHGLRRSLWPMSLSLALPCAVYLIMALMQPEQLWFIYFCVAFDQFGYGFGFTAYMLYMMHFSEGEFKTSHYAICTAFMALSMMVPGVFAGWLQEALGYVGFFIMVMICCLATVFVTWFARRRC